MNGIIHPFMPDISSKSLDEIVTEMNNIHTKMRFVSNGALREQMMWVLNGYQEAYARKLAEEANKSKEKKDRKR